MKKVNISSGEMEITCDCCGKGITNVSMSSIKCGSKIDWNTLTSIIKMKKPSYNTKWHSSSRSFLDFCSPVCQNKYFNKPMILETSRIRKEITLDEAKDLLSNTDYKFSHEDGENFVFENNGTSLIIVSEENSFYLMKGELITHKMQNFTSLETEKLLKEGF